MRINNLKEQHVYMGYNVSTGFNSSSVFVCVFNNTCVKRTATACLIKGIISKVW